VRTNPFRLSTYFSKLEHGWRLAFSTVRFLLSPDNRRETDYAIDFCLENMSPKATPNIDVGLSNIFISVSPPKKLFFNDLRQILVLHLQTKLLLHQTSTICGAFAGE
jgi:hypothetical protein